ncbi:MAG: Na+/H+ antiporter NhaC family protein [Planctomycetes bacterium]|nr:Na+/H+ antiporter NhaC family protein [Planctomycetota bacterium]
MQRFVSLFVLLALVAALILMPGADPAQLGALEVGDLLGESSSSLPVPFDTSGDPVPHPTHGQVILASSHVRDAEEAGGRILTLGRVVVIGPGGVPVDAGSDSESHVNASARRAILATLRELFAADSDGSSLLVDGETEPTPGGLDFELGVESGDWGARGSQRYLSYEGAGLQGLATGSWSPPEKSSLIPPLFAIALAVLFRKPVIALGLGVLVGTYLVSTEAGASVLASAATAPLDFVHPYFWNELISRDRYLIIGFVVAMLAMIGVLSRSGGIQGLMDHIARFSTTVRRTQIVTWVLGLLVFFDDYTNTIVCGATMRPLSDRFKISREKLAYLVDSTAAPVAGLMIVSTWIAFEVSTFSNQLPAAGLLTSDGYTVFLETLPYRFYCILTIFFVGLIVFSGRDFGPMLTAERRARRTGQLLRPGGQPMVSEEGTALETAPGLEPAAWRALVPITAFLFVTVWQILSTGGAFDGTVEHVLSVQGLKDVLGNASSSLALFQGSTTGLVLAVGIALLAKLGTETFRAAWTTLRSMGVAVVILYLAWMVAAVCGDLGTAPYLTALLGDSMHPAALPAILFVLSGLVSFATGTSWGTMGILLPLVVGLSFAIGERSDLGGHLVMVMSIGAVLEGSIFGDHCSPISDTTVLSSVACAADHVDHVRTQAPYALMTMGVGILFGYLPCAFFGMSPLLGLAVGASVLVAVVFTFGRKADLVEEA